jgi:hypothetical protein
MTEDVLHLPPGAMLQLQLASVGDQGPRYPVRVVGYVPGGSLIVTTPTAHGRVQLVREGQRCNVRMLCGNSVMGFVAHVLRAFLQPYPHLHLEYPREVERIMVRNAHRVPAGLTARVRDIRLDDVAENHRLVSLLDLSTTGAKLAADGPLGEIGTVLRLTFAITVAGQSEEVTLLGEIRSQVQREVEDGGTPSHVHGLQFRTVNRFQQLLLHGWVLERLIAEEGSGG